ncbi:MAG: M16 family metallopeptidase [Bacillota bacterium]
MKKLNKIIIYTLLIVFATTISIFASPQNFSPQFFEELAKTVNEKPEIEIPAYETLELANGMKFYLAQDKSLPLIEIRGYINGGKINENRDQAGITALMTEIMLLETQNYSEKELSFFKEANALSLDLAAGFDRISINANALSSESKELISLLAEVLEKPKFKGNHFKRTVKEYQQLYQQRFHNDSALLNMYFYKNIYGEHPYAYNYNYNLILDFLSRVQATDLADFYNQIVKPESTIIVINGDFNLREVKKQLKIEFANWEKQNKNQKLNKELVNVRPEIHNKIILVNKEDSTQAKLKMGYNFYTTNYAKKIPFMLGNKIFGGGSFNSRLMENLRSDKGYVYGINAQTRYHDYGGAYTINLSLNPAKTLLGMEAVKNELEKIKKGKAPFTQKELFENINLYNATFPKAYKEQIDILDQLVYQKEFYNKTDNYLNNYIEQYNGLQVKEVKKIFRENIYPEILFTVIVGPKAEILPQFEAAGLEVEVIDN